MSGYTDEPITQAQTSVSPWVKQGGPSTKGLIGIFRTLKKKCTLPVRGVTADKPPALEGFIPPPDVNGGNIPPLDVNGRASDSVNSYNSSSTKNTNDSTNSQQIRSIIPVK